MDREEIKLTDKELKDFDFTRTCGMWKLRGEEYEFVERIRRDKYCDGPCWNTIVKRKSDGKYFKWDCWDAGYHNGYIMSDGDNTITEVFPKETIIIEYE